MVCRCSASAATTSTGSLQLPRPLHQRLAAWLVERQRFEHVSDDEREDFFAWEDEGGLIRHELQGVWGVRVDYR